MLELLITGLLVLGYVVYMLQRRVQHLEEDREAGGCRLGEEETD